MQLPHDLLEVSTPGDNQAPGYDVNDPNIVMSLRRGQAARILAQLTRVEETLNRLDSRGFGVCTSCGKDIDEILLKKDLTKDKCASCMESGENNCENNSE